MNVNGLGLFWKKTLFKGENYIRDDTIQGKMVNYVCISNFLSVNANQFETNLMMSNNLFHNDTNHCNIHRGHFLVLTAYQVQLLTTREIFHAAFHNSNMLTL